MRMSPPIAMDSVSGGLREPPLRAVRRATQRSPVPRPEHTGTVPPVRVHRRPRETDFRPRTQFAHRRPTPAPGHATRGWSAGHRTPQRPPCDRHSLPHIDATPQRPRRWKTVPQPPNATPILQCHQPLPWGWCHPDHADAVESVPRRPVPRGSFDGAIRARPQRGPGYSCAPSVRQALKQGRGVGFRPGYRLPLVLHTPRSPRPRLGRVLNELPYQRHQKRQG